MPDVEPLFHMDSDYNWRWYIPDVKGSLVCMSTRSFFYYDEAKQDFDAVRQRLSE